ncbi:LacI family DNA-binding transcriptional regulator [Lachnoclostridium sp. Marseille-P6806]|uniref:LacI family DNA-binding transcriptional regulator n=1 Tax=Lachnoclostridium sp. Marseille-P6806 TaxID=2364793 RepID=UPI0013EF522E|nr:LacI family DNA-binding transcriptional regulator [Lachnoclostridium sp. Marseille-P6806]
MAVTRREVAELAKVSVATVSYVVNGTKRLSPEVTERVEEAVRTLGYRPNLVARGLATSKTQHVAILVDNLENPYYASLLMGAQRAAVRAGYLTSLLLIDDTDEEGIIRLMQRRLDGIIMASQRDAEIERLLSGEVPTVSSGEYVGIRYRDAIFSAVRSLAEKGHRRIAYVSGLREDNPDERCGSFKEAVAAAGLPFGEEQIVYGESRETTSERDGRRGVAELFRRGVRFTALMTTNDLMAIGAMDALRERGLCIPGDVSVVGCDNIEIGRFVNPHLSTIDVSSALAGEELMKLLLCRMRGEQAEKSIITGRYIERESVGALCGSDA